MQPSAAKLNAKDPDSSWVVSQALAGVNWTKYAGRKVTIDYTERGGSSGWPALRFDQIVLDRTSVDRVLDVAIESIYGVSVSNGNREVGLIQFVFKNGEVRGSQILIGDGNRVDLGRLFFEMLNLYGSENLSEVRLVHTHPRSDSPLSVSDFEFIENWVPHYLPSGIPAHLYAVPVGNRGQVIFSRTSFGRNLTN